MKVGIVGLPQAGSTTVFNALTGAHGDVGGYHPGEHLSASVVRVPDERLDALAALLQPKEAMPATIHFEDVGGVFSHVAGADHSPRAVAALRDTDAVLMVLRSFESPFVLEVFGEVNPLHEYNAMLQEMLLADLEVIEKRLAAVEHDLRKATPERELLQREQAVLERCRRAVEGEEGLLGVQMDAAEERMLRSYAFLTLKPRLCVLNIGEEQIPDPPGVGGVEQQPIAICAEFEMELTDLDEDDRPAFMADAGLQEPAASRLIRACYEEFGLRSFFTCVSDKLRAWTVEAGAKAPEAAGKIHTDMEKGFIRAEVVAFQDLLDCGSLKEAKAQGKLRMEGKDYEVQDGDVITFHFSR